MSDRVRITDDLLFALKQRPPDVQDLDDFEDDFEPKRCQVAETRVGVSAALHRHLGLGWRSEYYSDDESTSFLLALVDPIEEILRTKPPRDPDDWAKRQLLIATKGMNKWCLLELIEAFDFDDRTIVSVSTQIGPSVLI